MSKWPLNSASPTWRDIHFGIGFGVFIGGGIADHLLVAAVGLAWMAVVLFAWLVRDGTDS